MKQDRRGDVPSRTYLVVVSEVIVAQDLAMTIEEFDRDARVILARSAAEALAQLDRLQSAVWAFVAVRFGGTAELEAAVISAGGRVVLLGGDAQRSSRERAILDLPFDSAAVHAILRGLAT